MSWDYSYILIIIGAILSIIASINVKSTYNKYSKVLNSKQFTADECAAKILHDAGIDDVRIEKVAGNLTDHYAPKEKVLRLSQKVFGSTSVVALGVAAHECGHAIQHSKGYGPLKLRSAAVPVANIGSTIALPVFFIGLLLGSLGLARVGVFMFAFVVIFQVITLPVEFNASKRAIAILEQDGMLAGGELTGAKKVLNAAALTYVAALLSSILMLLRLILLTQGGRGGRR